MELKGWRDSWSTISGSDFMEFTLVTTLPLWLETKNLSLRPDGDDINIDKLYSLGYCSMYTNIHLFYM